MRDEPRQVQLPWQGIAALTAVITGAVWYLTPINTSRPPAKSGLSLRVSSDQDVDARLWQDPLAAAVAHDDEVGAIDPKELASVNREKSLHAPGNLKRLIERTKSSVATARGDFFVLPVFVSGGAYTEYSENRLRARRAVLEALGTNGISPRDGEHIGYVNMTPLDTPEPLPPTHEGPPMASAGEGPSTATSATTGAAGEGLSVSTPAPTVEPGSRRNFVLPYEWCEYVFTGGTFRQQVLILWVREEELAPKPLNHLLELLKRLGVEHDRVQVIGPRTSTALKAIVDEVTAEPFEPQKLASVTIFSPTATVSEELLLRDRAGGVNGTLKTYLEARSGGLTFHRITSADDRVCRALIHELGRRQVRLDLRNSKECGHRGGADNVALISEWDTFYGRALPMTFAREVSDWSFEQLEKRYPANLHPFHYLRGVDGMLPGAEVATQAGKTQEALDARRRPLELPEGLNQADSLRRLADRLAEKHRELVYERKGGLKAVGILGSDVYDKLMVLKALRTELPGVLFFTNDLDARLGHPDEWRWARNLIVASPFGLRLKKRWDGGDERRGLSGEEFPVQGKILPFRDAYQTAAYAATLFASNASAIAVLDNGDSALGKPRMFEIAQSGPYELPATLRQPNEPQDLHPITDEHWWSDWRKLFIAGIGLAIGALIGWLSIVVKGFWSKADERPSTAASDNTPTTTLGVAGSAVSAESRLTRVMRRLAGIPSWAVFGVAALMSWLLIAVVANSEYAGGEPFLWNEGISIWPTETIRLLAVTMALWYLFKTYWSLYDNERTILDQFGLPPPERLCPDDAWWKEVAASVKIDRWQPKNGRIVAIDLWKQYVRTGRWGGRALRILPLALCYIGAGVCLIFLLGDPPVPGRGESSFKWDFTFLTLGVLFSVYLTFYVADATMMNCRLIKSLVLETTEWPTKAYDRLRRRWIIPKDAPAAQTGDALTSAADSISDQDAKASESNAAAGSEAATTKGETKLSDPPPTRRILDEYLDIDLIAMRTDVVGGLIYYPFVVITLLIVSRISLFDNWTWPPGLLAVIAGNGGYAAWSAAKLRTAAEEARQTALGKLNDILIARTAEGHGSEPEAQTARETIAIIQAERRGAFASISRHPLLGALLLPSGGAGLWALTQYLPGLF